MLEVVFCLVTGLEDVSGLPQEELVEYGIYIMQPFTIVVF